MPARRHLVRSCGPRTRLIRHRGRGLWLQPEPRTPAWPRTVRRAHDGTTRADRPAHREAGRLARTDSTADADADHRGRLAARQPAVTVVGRLGSSRGLCPGLLSWASRSDLLIELALESIDTARSRDGYQRQPAPHSGLCRHHGPPAPLDGCCTRGAVRLQELKSDRLETGHAYPRAMHVRPVCGLVEYRRCRWRPIGSAQRRAQPSRPDTRLAAASANVSQTPVSSLTATSRSIDRADPEPSRPGNPEPRKLCRTGPPPPRCAGQTGRTR